MTPRNTARLFACTAVAFATACAPSDADAPSASFTPDGMDPSVAPGDDFFRHVNGVWLDTVRIPDDMGGYGVGARVFLATEQQTLEIVRETAEGEHQAGTPAQQVGDFWASWMDTETIEAAGLDPLAEQLAEIEAAASHDDIARLFGDLDHVAPYGMQIIPDLSDPTRYSAAIGQAGLGMPVREYYLSDDETFAGYRDAYVEYITTVMELAGHEAPAAAGQSILEVETRIAEVHWTPAQSRDIGAINNPMTLDEMDALGPAFGLARTARDLGLGDLETIIVAQPSAIEGASEIFAATPVDVWKDYLTFHQIRSASPRLASAFADAHFEFFQRTLGGVEEQRERELRGMQMLDGRLGEAVGRVYVERHFPPEAKAEMLELIDNLTAGFESRLANLAWMDDATRENALRKLSTFEAQIGYPDEWIDYSSVEIRPDDLVGNARRLDRFGWQRQVDRLDEPVDRTEWSWPPQTVNASYSPLLNMINFPAGILQPPFFDLEADAALNYGAIGAVIGHEIGHGFDDQGRRFDYDGAVRDWWTEETNQRFEVQAERLGAQYATYSPVEGMFIDPELTMGENLGDLGGVEMAYTAYRRYVDEHHGGEAPVIDGYTGDQRFFIAYAMTWRSIARDDVLVQQIASDPHSAAEFRVNGVVRNVDAWYDAFGVTEEHAMYLPPEERVRIW
jgi:endothelin-converting enzyme/putative endopeptidase